MTNYQERQLFADKRFDEWSEQQLEKLDRQVNLQGAEAIARGDIVPSLVSTHATRPLVLLRDQASWDLTPAAGGVRAVLTVPTEGSVDLWNVRPGSVPQTPVVRAHVVLNGPGVPATLTMEKSFDSIEIEPVRAWAAELADAIQLWIDAQRPYVDQFNRTVTARVEALVRGRRSQLDAVQQLKRDLDAGGI